MTRKKDQESDDEVVTDALLSEYHAHQLMGQTRDYLARGRQWQQTSDDELRDHWIDALKRWFASRRRADVPAKNDIEAELRLRGLEPPHSAVANEYAQLRDELKQGKDAKTEQISDELDEGFASFLDLRSRPKH